MDVTSLLNTAGSGSSSKPPRTSASPSITESGHTAPSSALPTPSPERALGPSECERSPRHNPSLWGPRGYSLSLALESKPRSGSVFSYQADGRTETESESGHYNSSRNNSVCSGEVSASSHSPRTLPSRLLLAFISPEQSDAEHGGMEPRNSAAASHSSLSTYASSASRPHSRVSSVTTIGALQSVKDAALHHARRNSLDHSASQRDIQHTSQTEEEELRSIQANGNLLSKMHKRTMSAPDIAQCSVARMPRHAAQPIISETVSSRPSVEQSVEDSRRQGSTTATDGTSMKQQDQEAYCMFVKDCDTGSQLRKAISHLFGRNKACTLRIPKHVWVYYCRKHYQRIRYRNAKTYPLNQMELVKLQILRLQAWSEDNRKQHNGAYIRMWTLSLRKREQSRIENGSGAGVSVDEAALAVNDARNMAGTAVPEWLIQRVASGYTTEEILDVAERLHKEIKDGLLAQVPEIEFLPDIVDADSGAASKSARSSRRQSRLSNGGGGSSGIKTPKRKAPESLDFGRRDSVYSDGRGGEYYPLPPHQQHHQLHHQQHHHHPGHYHYPGEETYDVVSPSGKRARVVRAPPPPPPGYGPPRPDSAQLPPLASALSYGEMQPPPPPPPPPPGSNAPPPTHHHHPQATRAPNVVPRIQPLEYRRGSSSNSNGYGTSSPPDSYYPGQQPAGPPHPQARWEGYESSPHSARSEGSAYALCNGEYRYGNAPPPPPHGQQQQQPLPPISAQLEGRFPRGAPPPPGPPEHRGRPHHWRSASAYVPGDHHHQHHRGAPMPGRPLSSGHEVPPHHPPAPPPGYAREYEQQPQQQAPHPPPPHHHHHHHYGPEHEQYTYSWPRGQHGSQPPPPAGHVPRQAVPAGVAPQGYPEESWSREGRVVYGGRP
ncbi:hypothetical protein PWT90_05417 [Aphanocladium album]|nr:hypothetical protein PWT90_05417 [Aphanocladium album]